MKINKKTIVIIILVSLVVFLIWKKSKNSKVESTTEEETPPTDTTSMDYILSHVSFTSNERNMIQKLIESCNSSATTRQYYESKAYEKGRPFDQQLVLEAIWKLYTKDNKWIPGPDGDTSYGWKLQQKVLSL